jgi:ABC-type nitrate/sulfonate/bicarbonate transport system permease component
MATVFAIYLCSFNFTVTRLLLGASVGAIGGVVVAFLLGRYRRGQGQA